MSRRMVRAVLSALPLWIVPWAILVAAVNSTGKPALAATFQVTTATGGISNTGSLPWAIASANSAGSGPHTIEINGALGNLSLPEDLPVISVDMTIVGNDVTIDADGHRGFFVGDGLTTINVSIEHLEIDGAKALGGAGGNGSGGGGGGLGAGGGLFVNKEAHVTLDDVHFQGNWAAGGDGGSGNGSGSPSGGGGGGGFGGAGGTATSDGGAGGGGFAGAGGTAGIAGSGGGGQYGNGGASAPGIEGGGGGGGGQRGNGGAGGAGAGGGGGGSASAETGQDGGLVIGGSGAGPGGKGGDVFTTGSSGTAGGGGGGGGYDPLVGKSGGSGGNFGGGAGGGAVTLGGTPGGAGGAGGVFGGGGGGGLGDHGGQGGQGNDFGGGGGGGTGLLGGGNAGVGGYGAGGGGGGKTVVGSQGSGGAGGFGAGDGGDATQGGDGGDGYGGAIFVRQGGTLTFLSGFVDQSNLALPGSGGTGPGGNGSGGTAASAIRLEGTNLIVDGSGLTAFTAEVGGSGAVIKNGSGTLMLNGYQPYQGGTTINQGTLVVNGILVEGVTVNPGGILAGNATVNGSVVLNGTISPGNSIGVVTIGGNLTTAASSTVDIEINNLGESDRINVDGVAQLNGGTVNIQPAAGNYSPGTKYTFLTAAGGVNGQFSGAIEDLPFLDAVLLYSPQFVQIELKDNTVCYACIAADFNQFQVGTCLDGLETTATGDLSNVFDQLNTLTTPQAQSALQSMDAEVYASLAQLSVQNLQYQYLLLRQRVGTGLGGGLQSSGGLASNARDFGSQDAEIVFVRGDGGNSLPVVRQVSRRCRAWSAWALGYGIGGDVQSDGNAGGADYGLGGMLVSLERFLGDQHALGFWGSYANLNLNVTDPVQSGHANDEQFGSYLTGDDGFNYWLAAGSLGFDGYGAVREMHFGDINRTAQSTYTGWQSAAYGERGVRFFWGRALIQPFLAMQYIYVRQNALSETGADSLNLAVHGTDTNALRGLLGTRVAQPWRTRSGQYLVPELRAIWLHEFLAPETALNARFAGIGGASFITRGLNYGRDWAVLGGGLNWFITSNFGLFANYDVQVNARQTFHVGSGGAQFVW